METNKHSHFQRSLVMLPAQSHHPKDLMLWLNYSLALPCAEEAEPLPACLDNSVLLCLPVMGKRRRILRKSLSFQCDLCWGFHCLFFSQELRNLGTYHLPHFLTFASPPPSTPCSFIFVHWSFLGQSIPKPLPGQLLSGVGVHFRVWGIYLQSGTKPERCLIHNENLVSLSSKILSADQKVLFLKSQESIYHVIGLV